MVAIPTLLFAFGLWQERRAFDELSSYSRKQAELPQTLLRLRRIAATSPYAVVRSSDGAAYGASLAVTMVEETIPSVARHVLLARARYRLGQGTALGAALALLAGLIGLATTSVSGLRARRSRDRLIGSFAFVCLTLPFQLGCQVVGFATALVCAVLFELGGIPFSAPISAATVKLVAAGLLTVAMAIYCAVVALRGLRQVFALFTPATLDVAGVAVEEAGAPALWRFVREIARRQESIPPDAIVLGLTEGFFVTEATVRLHPDDLILSGRTLYLPAPYFGLLNGREIAAIVGHELAHFSGEDTAYSRRFAPLYARLWRALSALRGAGMGLSLLQPAISLADHAGHTFDAAVARWSRLREFEADRRGSTAGGAQAAATALVRTGLVADVVASVLQQAFAEPDECAEDLVAQVVASSSSMSPAEALARLDGRSPHPVDSHPPSRQRIAALDVAIDETLIAASTRAPGEDERALPAMLFGDWAGLCRRLALQFLDQARDRRSALLARLVDMSKGMPAERSELFENARPMIWTMSVLAVLLSIFAVAATVFARPLGLAHDWIASAMLLSACGAGALGSIVFAALIWHRSREPFLVLDVEGLRSPLFREVVTWEDVADFRVTVGRRLGLRLTLRSAAPLPVRSGLSMQIAVDRRRRSITIKSLGIRGMKPAALVALLKSYLQAQRARTILARRTVPLDAD